MKYLNQSFSMSTSEGVSQEEWDAIWNEFPAAVNRHITKQMKDLFDPEPVNNDADQDGA